MLNRVKRSIITSLALISGAIFSSTLLAQAIVTAPVITSTQPPTEQKSIQVSPDQSPALPPKQYLLEGDSPLWLNDSLNKLEEFQVWLGGHVQNTGEGIDDYFGTEESFEVSKNSRLDIMLPMIIHDSGETELLMRMRAKFAFPKMRKRWHLLFTSEESSIKGQPSGTVANEVLTEESSTSLALQIMLDSVQQQELILVAGSKLTDGVKLDPYFRLKKRFQWDDLAGWKHRMSHALFWESVAGPGLESKLVFDKPVQTDYLFRTQTEGIWWQDKNYYDLIQRLLLYQTLNPYRLLTHQVWMGWNTQVDNIHNTGYGLSINWRERVYKNWLYFEVQPGVEWSDENDFKDPDITLMLMLEMRFFQKP